MSVVFDPVYWVTIRARPSFDQPYGRKCPAREAGSGFPLPSAAKHAIPVARYTLDMAGMPAGRHKVKIDLVDANHEVFPGQSKTETFTISKGASHSHWSGERRAPGTSTQHFSARGAARQSSHHAPHLRLQSSICTLVGLCDWAASVASSRCWVSLRFRPTRHSQPMD